MLDPDDDCSKTWGQASMCFYCPPMSTVFVDERRVVIFEMCCLGTVTREYKYQVLGLQAPFVGDIQGRGFSTKKYSYRNEGTSKCYSIKRCSPPVSHAPRPQIAPRQALVIPSQYTITIHNLYLPVQHPRRAVPRFLCT
jgi:hypothetical protein